VRAKGAATPSSRERPASAPVGGDGDGGRRGGGGGARAEMNARGRTLSPSPLPTGKRGATTEDLGDDDDAYMMATAAAEEEESSAVVRKPRPRSAPSRKSSNYKTVGDYFVCEQPFAQLPARWRQVEMVLLCECGYCFAVNACKGFCYCLLLLIVTHHTPYNTPPFRNHRRTSGPRSGRSGRRASKSTGEGWRTAAWSCGTRRGTKWSTTAAVRKQIIEYNYDHPHRCVIFIYFYHSSLIPPPHFHRSHKFRLHSHHTHLNLLLYLHTHLQLSTLHLFTSPFREE
jgi:hypothetical protein